MTEDTYEQRDSIRPRELIGLGELTIRSDRAGDVHTIRLTGELDLATADHVESELERVEATDAASIVLDLSGLTFMDSTACASSSARTRGHASRDGA